MKPIYVKKNGEVNKISGIVNPSSYSADDITYDGSTSGLTADDVQEAIDEIVDGLGTAASKNVGVSNGVAELDSSGKVPSSQLPSYVDDVIEVDDYSHLPITGESGKIYVTRDTSLEYRWSGTTYVQISKSVALGNTHNTAFYGDWGEDAYDHATETKLSTATASGLYKVAGTAQGHIASLTAVTKDDITGLGISDENVKQSPSTDNAMYEVLFSGTADNTEHTEGVKKSNKLLFNPSTGGLMNGNAGVASGSYSHAEGSRTTAQSDYSHAEGYYAFTNGNYSHAEGVSTSANGLYSHAEGHQTAASSTASHSEGVSTSANGSYSHAEGLSTITSGSTSHAEGRQTTAYGDYSHAEGYKAITIGNYSHAEGQDTKAAGDYSHAEGFQTSANGSVSHAEGRQTTASGDFAHSEGYATIASNTASHAEGNNTTASGKYSHAEGVYTSAAGEGQLVIGKYNTPDTTSLFIIGNGTNTTRSNAMTVDATGNLSITKINGVTVGNSPKFTDTKVTSVGNHYTPTCSGTFSASASGATAAWSIDVVKGVTLQKDAAGHITGVSVTSGKIPANPNTDTKVTSVGNHYTPTCSGTFSKSASGGTAAWSVDVVTGITLQKDAAGHIVDMSITSGKTAANPIPSNNITGSGTSGYIAKFNGTNTITNGPQLGSSTSTYLRNDGSWATPTDTDNRKSFYGTCDTAAATAAKVVTLADTAGWELKAGTIVGVKFTNTNTASNVTLNVNGTGAKSIWYGQAAYTGSSTTICGYAARMIYYMYDGSTYWMWLNHGIDANDNTYDRNLYNGAIKCGTTAIAKNNIIVGKDGVFHQLNDGTAFDVSYQILYAGSDIAASATSTNNYDVIPFTITTTQSITLTAYKPVYIKGTLSGVLFTPYQAACLIQTVPTTDDGYYYMYLGTATSTTAVYLQERHPIFTFIGGKFQETSINSGIRLSGTASANMTYASTNPQISFSENGTQGVKILYTDYDSYRMPYGLKVIGDNSGGAAWFEVEGNIYCNSGKYNSYFTATPTSGQVVITDGTTGGAKSSGYTIAKSVPSNADFTNTWRPVQNNLTSDSTTDSLSAAQGKALANGSARDSTKLPLAGGTMTGQIKTSFKESIAMGTYGATSNTIENLCGELRYSSGVAGSVSIGTAYTKDGVTISTGWYNFFWIPHRSGGVNGAASGDNCDYGTLFLMGMTVSGGYVIRYASQAIAQLRNIYADTNTDTLVTQTATTTNAAYEVLFSATADNTTRTETARKNSNLLFNPSSGALYGTNEMRSRDLSVSTNNGTSGGISLYSSSSQMDNYGLYFRATSNKEKHGYIQGDWATYFTMNDQDNRGWIFRRNKTGGNVASIDTKGQAVFNGSVTIGGNAANTSGARLEFNSNTNTIDFIFN